MLAVARSISRWASDMPFMIAGMAAASAFIPARNAGRNEGAGLDLLTDLAIGHLRLAAHRPALVGSSGLASFDRRLDFADWKLQENLRHRHHRIGQPVRPFRVHQLGRQLDGVRRSGWRRLLGKHR